MSDLPAARLTPHWSGFLGRRPVLVTGGAIIAGFVLLALLAPVIAPYDPILQDGGARLLPPSLAHPFGTDNFGRDVLSRVIWASRIDLQIALLGVAFPFLIGTIAGTLAPLIAGVWLPITVGLLGVWVAWQARRSRYHDAFSSLLLALAAVSVSAVAFIAPDALARASLA